MCDGAVKEGKQVKLWWEGFPWSVLALVSRLRSDDPGARMIPKNITSEHLLKAIREIDRDGVPVGSAIRG